MKLQPILIACFTFMLAACSPEHDWRVVHNHDHGWQATFPAKPVQFSRELTLPGTSTPVRLTLSSAKVGEAMFAVGWISNGNESTRKSLETAMLANINADRAKIQNSAVSVSGLPAQAVTAQGQMRIQADSEPVPVRMLMRSLAIGGQQPMVIEILAVGPEADLAVDIAEQFVESLRINR